MDVLGEHGRRRLRAPPRESGIAIGRIADKRQVIGNRLGRDAELRDHTGLVACRSRSPIHLHDTRAADRLRQVLVGRADQDALYSRIGRSGFGSCRQRIVGFEFHHRPDRDAEGRQRLLQQRELREEIRRNARSGLVARPEVVAERLDHMVGCDANVRHADLHEAEKRCEHAADGPHLAAITIARRRHCEVVTKEFVRAVDEIDVQKNSPSQYIERRATETGTIGLKALPRRTRRRTRRSRTRRVFTHAPLAFGCIPCPVSGPFERGQRRGPERREPIWAFRWR